MAQLPYYLQFTDDQTAFVELRKAGLMVDANGFTPVDGVVIAGQGGATLQGPNNTAVKGNGYFALVRVDDEKLPGIQATMAPLLAAYEWKGAQIIGFLGETTTRSNMLDRIERTALKNRTSFRTTGQNWYSYLDDAGDPLIGTYAAWVSLGEDITAAAVRVVQMDGSSQAVTPTLARAILTAAVTNQDLWRTRARQAKTAYLAAPTTWKMSDANWPAVYVAP
jgi:hypothetical protein